MTPGADHILLNAIGTLTLSVAPEVTSPFGQGQLSLIAVLMYFAAIEHDAAADIRTRENREMRDLFADAARMRTGLDDSLRAALQEAAEGADPDLRLSTLNSANSELKTLLIRLHERLETHAGMEARRFEARIWKFLRSSADARALALPEPA
jgi:hypothetical protein